MTWRVPAVANVAIAAALLLPGAAAVHMTQYQTNPVEHDDQGRANEPDGAQAGLYDVVTRDCTLDVTGDGRCSAVDRELWPAGAVVAPGCTDDVGRQPSGACGLFTVGVGTLATGNVVAPLPPPIGDPGPCLLPAGQRPLRVLDVHQAVFPTVLAASPDGHAIFEVNRKLQDVGAFAMERRLGLGDGSDAILAGGVAVLAWYGLYFDKNCNGVIDHFGTSESDPRNEFTWIGDDCLDVSGVNRVPPDVCQVEPGTELLGWEFPGNHHAFAGCLTCPPGVPAVFLPADAPGQLALCTLLGGGDADCDDAEAGFAGDPLLGPQDGSAPDWYFFPYYLGDASPYNRVYVAANNWPLYHYDPSIVVTTTVVGAVNPAGLGDGQGYDLSRASFVDVDVLKSRHPALEAYVQTLVKPALRGAWLTLREAL